MIPSTKVAPMSLLKNKTIEVDCSSRLQKLTLVLLMFMATGCVSRPSDAEYCTDMRVVPTQEFNCTYMNPWSVICSRKRVYKPVCARWA